MPGWLIPGERNAAARDRLPCGDIWFDLLTEAIEGLNRAVEIVATADVDVGAAIIGLVTGLDSGDGSDLVLPPQGRHETNFPNVLLEDCRDAVLVRTGLETLRFVSRCLAIEGPNPAIVKLSLRTTLVLLSVEAPLAMVGLAVTLLKFVPAAVKPSGRNVNWLGRTLRVWMSIPFDMDMMDSCEMTRRSL